MGSRETGLSGLRASPMADNMWAVVADSVPLNQSLAIIALFTIGFVPIVGTAAAAVFITAAIACVVLRPAEVGRSVLSLAPLFVLPILAIVSTMWSDAPEQTLRAGLQLLIMFVAAIAVCRRLDPSTMILVVFANALAVDLIALTTVQGSLASGLPFLGPFASKNAMGYTAMIHIALSVAVLFDGNRGWLWRLAASLSIPFALGLLVLTQSAGANASTGVIVMLFLVLAFLGKVPMPVRVCLVVLAFVLAALGAAFASDITDAFNAFRQDVLHKDATLTGRTYLWNYAAELVRQRPLLGHGYYAFWRQGNVEAEGLWRWGGIASRSGFNFHNAVVEMNVDLGMVGVVTLVTSCLAVLVLAVYRHLTNPSVPLAFLIALLVMFYIRSYAESGMLSPFSLSTMMWVATAYYAQANKPTAGSAWQTVARSGPRPRRTPGYARGRS